MHYIHDNVLLAVDLHFIRSKPHSLLSLWKNALELFVWNKSLINSKHEFAIVLLEDKEAVWVRTVCILKCSVIGRMYLGANEDPLGNIIAP